MTSIPTLRRIPMKTIGAHPIRSAIILILALAQAACVFASLLMVDGMRHELSLAERRLGAELVVYPTSCLNQVDKRHLLMQGTPVHCRQPRTALARMATNEDIEAVSYQLYISDTLPGGQPLWIVGFDPATDFVISPWIGEGEETELARGSILVGSSVEKNAQGGVTLFGRNRPAGAHLLETGSVLDGAVFVSMDTLADIIEDSVDAGVHTYANLSPESEYSVALVRASASDNIESVTDWINLYVRKVTAIRSDAALVDTASDIRSHRGISIVMLALCWVILLAALVVAQITLMNERLQEVHVWRSIGASRATIRGLMVRESAILHAAGACVGALVTVAVLLVSGDATIREALASPTRALPLVGLTIAVSILAGTGGTAAALKRLAWRAQGHKLVLV